ncbi:rhomboid family intramembrane serine protease [Ningiella sp. W23]|uniref:rhomboid family intramembrane serine protease n=1 Tax=Ningiella sp. W23 TaxID=3023715 RepID=UPI0037576095
MSIKEQANWVGMFCALFFAVELLNFFSARSLSSFGIIPRDIASLWHIFTAPFIHGSFSHFASNIITLAIFSVLLFQYGRQRFVLITILLIVITGILVWLFGRRASHIGASGLLYGYFGYLVIAGFLSKSIRQLLISILVGFFYISLLWGVFPVQARISWESHLFGLLSGIILAYLLRPRSAHNAY